VAPPPGDGVLRCDMMAICRQMYQIDREESEKLREEREPVDSGTNDDTHDLPASQPLDESGMTLSGGENAVDGVQIETVEIGMGKRRSSRLRLLSRRARPPSVSLSGSLWKNATRCSVRGWLAEGGNA